MLLKSMFAADNFPICVGLLPKEKGNFGRGPLKPEWMFNLCVNIN